MVTSRFLLLALALAAVLLAGACRSGKGAAGGELGPPWNKGGLRAERAASAASGLAAHATGGERESSWTGKGFARPAKSDEAAQMPAGAAGKRTQPPEGVPLAFDDCVVLAARQAPDLVESVISLGVAEIATDTAFWRRFPSINARFRITANLTQQHEEYSESTARLDFGIYGFEPVASHFSHKVARLMEDIALSTHQMAVEKRGLQLGESLLRLENLERTRELQTAEADLAKQLTAFHKASQGESADRLEIASALHQEKAAQSALDKNDAAIASQHLSLKLMLGIDPDRRIEVRGASARETLQNEKAANALAGAWAEAWNGSLEARIARVTVKLQDYNVMMAWARYLPTMTLEVISDNPSDDYATYSSKDDFFAHLYFTLPLFDWGERSRGVDSARLQKTQATYRGRLSRQTFAQKWNEQWLDMKMARADLDLAGEKVAVARLEEQKAALEHKSGNLSFDALVTAKRKVITEEIALENASLQLRLRELAAWVASGSFRKRFFEPRDRVVEDTPL